MATGLILHTLFTKGTVQREDGSGGFGTVEFPLVLVLDQGLDRAPTIASRCSVVATTNRASARE